MIRGSPKTESYINFSVINLHNKITPICFQDFSDWQPTSTFEGTKQPKRANEEKESGMRKRSGKENITASGDSSPRVNFYIIYYFFSNICKLTVNFNVEYKLFNMSIISIYHN